MVCLYLARFQSCLSTSWMVKKGVVCSICLYGEKGVVCSICLYLVFPVMSFYFLQGDKGWFS